MNEQELNLNEMEEIAGGKGKYDNEKGGSSNPLPPKAGCIVYKVQPNDNLTRIAERYNTTIAKIMAVNTGIITNKNFIRSGFYIYVPVA